MGNSVNKDWYIGLVLILLVGIFTPGSSLWAQEAEEPDPESIYNYHPVSESLSTAGQVFPIQLPWLESQDFDLVINLAVANKDRNLEESFHVTNSGMSYVQIPVDWDNPTQADLDLFFAVMDARGERKTLVHCFANYRASAFTYLYRVLREQVPEVQARADLEVIWRDGAFEESPQWRTFVDDVLTSGGITPPQ
jgi:protein tyrosine phosphatase (PTP) superfamily phosphohydrolase (DUF442 family)